MARTHPSRTGVELASTLAHIDNRGHCLVLGWLFLRPRATAYDDAVELHSATVHARERGRRAVSQEIVITNATVNGNVALSSGGGAVVKDSDINGNISVNNARNLTFVDNAVNGNVECLVSNTHGSRNSITGDVSGDCTELR